MNSSRTLPLFFSFAVFASFAGSLPLSAESTIDASHRFAYGANIGWTNWKHDQPAPDEGAVIGLKFCSGDVYGANVGWIDLGNGAPTDGIAYSNASATDFGVNVTSINTLTNEAALEGFAYGANIGWINFEQTFGQPKINLLTGEFAGHAWSANCGWINLANGGGVNPLKTGTLDQGPDTDADMIPDWWELEQVLAAGLVPADLSHLAETTDSDGDGMNDLDEFAGDTNPFDTTDALRIEIFDVRTDPADNVDVFWTSKTTRLYEVEQVLLPGFAPLLADIPGTGGLTGGTLTINPLPPSGYVRIIVKPPLSP